MAKVLISNKFSAGEVSKFLEDRSDYTERKNAARKLINVSPRSTGGVIKRPGLQHIGSLGNSLFRRIFAWQGGENDSFGLAQSATGEWRFFGTEITPSGVVPIIPVQGFTPPGVSEDTQVFTYGNVALISDGNIPHQIDRSGVSTINGTILLAKDTTQTTAPTASTLENYGATDYEPNVNTNYFPLRTDNYPYLSSVPNTQPAFSNTQIAFSHFDSDAQGTNSARVRIDDVLTRIIPKPHPTDNTKVGFSVAASGVAAFGSADFTTRTFREVSRTYVQQATWNNGGVETAASGTARYFNAGGIAFLFNTQSPLTGSFTPNPSPPGMFRLRYSGTNLPAGATGFVEGNINYINTANQHYTITVGTGADLVKAFGSGTSIPVGGIFILERIVENPNITDISMSLQYFVAERTTTGGLIRMRFNGTMPSHLSDFDIRTQNPGGSAVPFITAAVNQELTFPISTTLYDGMVATAAKSATTPSEETYIRFHYTPPVNATPPENKTGEFVSIGAVRTGTGSDIDPVEWVAVYFKGVERYRLNTSGSALQRITDPDLLLTSRVAALYVSSALETNTVDFMRQYRQKVLPLLNALPTTALPTEKQAQQHTAGNLNSALTSGTVMLTPREITNPPVKYWASNTEYTAELTRIGSQYGVNLAAGQKMKWNGTALVTEAIGNDDLQVPIGRYTMEWNSVDGWYRTTASRDSRVVHGGSFAFPNKLWFSTAEKANDFQRSYVERPGEGVDQSPLGAQVLSDFGFSRFIDGSDPIQNMYSGQSFQIYGRSGEYVMFGSLDASNLSRLEIRRYGSLGSRASAGVVEIDEHTFYYTGNSAVTLFYLSDEQGYQPFNLNAQYNEDIFKTYWNDTFLLSGAMGTTGQGNIIYNGLIPKRVIRLAGGNTGDINSGYPVYFLDEDGWLKVFHTEHKSNNRQGFFAWSRYNFFHDDNGNYNQSYSPMPDSVDRKMVDIMTSNRQTFLLDNYGELYFLNPDRTYDEIPNNSMEQVPIPIEIETATAQIVDLPEQGFVIPKELQGVNITFERLVGQDNDNNLSSVSVRTTLTDGSALEEEITTPSREGQTPVYFNEGLVVAFDAGSHNFPGIVGAGTENSGGDPVRIVIKSNTTYPYAISRVDTFWGYNSKELLSARI